MTKKTDTGIQGRWDAPLGGAPLEMRDRALLEIARARGIGVEDLVALDLADVTPLEQASGVVCAWLDRGRPALLEAVDGAPELALFLSKTGRRLAPSDARRRLKAETQGNTSTTRPHSRVESKRLWKAYARAHPRA